MYKKRVFAFIFALSLLVGLCSCAKPETKAQYIGDSIKTSVSSQRLAENQIYELLWNEAEKCVLLKNKISGKIWSTIPYKSLDSENRNINLNSTLNITVMPEDGRTKAEIKGYSGAVENGRTLSKKIDGGIEITYCFDEQKIAVPVSFVLREDSVLVTVAARDIVEAGEYRLTSFSLLPYFASAKNAKEDSYLFIPSGSGALVFADESVDGIKKFSGEIYGADGAELLTARMSPLPKLNLPVFGVKDQSDALFAIIEQGADSAVISLESGNMRTDYSNIYPTFKVRGTDTVTPPTVNLTTDDISLISDTASDAVFAIAYYPLENEKADYNGMAEKYRSYLQEKESLEKSDVRQSPYHVTFYGGVLSTKTTLGIPNKQLNALTTISQAELLTKELSSNIAPASVRLMGFGSTGVLPGKIAGGYRIASVLGSEKNHSDYEEYCRKNGITLFTDYDLVRIAQSGSGFSVSSSVAKSATLRKAVQYYKQLPLQRDNKEVSFFLLGRRYLQKAVDKLIQYAGKKNIGGISLSSFGSLAYSDFQSNQYVCKNKMSVDVADGLQAIRKNGHKIASSDANGYAALYSDVIYDVPANHGGYRVLDESIPFYQMVFTGFKTLVSAPLNTSSDTRIAMMSAAQSGMSLGYSLIADFSVSNLEINSEKFYAMLYEDNAATIREQLEAYQELYEAVGGSALIRFEKVNDTISKSIFENGVTVLTNGSSETVTYGGKTLDGYGFVCLGGSGS